MATNYPGGLITGGRSNSELEFFVKMILPDLLKKKDALERRLLLSGRTVLEDVPITRYISCLDVNPPYSSYRHVSQDIQKICSHIALRWSKETLDTYHRLLLIHLMTGFAERPKPVAFSSSIVDLYYMEFRRIVRELETKSVGFYLFPNDLFFKDLGLCRLVLIPVGSELIEIDSGISRHILFQGSLTQFLKGLKFFTAKTGGFKPFFQIHLDSRKEDEFNCQQRTLCYLNIAEILKLNGQIKGVFGGSWFYDPQIEKISPRLAYLRRLPLAHGAQTFYFGSDEQALANALHKSPTRRQYYKNGQYLPSNYILVWPRQELLAWAEQYQAMAAKRLF